MTKDVENNNENSVLKSFYDNEKKAIENKEEVKSIDPEKQRVEEDITAFTDKSQKNSENLEEDVYKNEKKDYKIDEILSNYKDISRHFYAGFWLRLVAYCLDLMVVLATTKIINVVTFNKLSVGYDMPLIGSSLVGTIVYFLYFILMTYFLSQTLGKMIVGIKVETNKGEKLKLNDVIFREVVGRLLTMGFLNIPYLAIAFNDKKKGLNDFVADTVVVKEDFSTIRKQINEKIFEFNN